MRYIYGCFRKAFKYKSHWEDEISQHVLRKILQKLYPVNLNSILCKQQKTQSQFLDSDMKNDEMADVILATWNFSLTMAFPQTVNSCQPWPYMCCLLYVHLLFQYWNTVYTLWMSKVWEHIHVLLWTWLKNIPFHPHLTNLLCIKF